jgi:hypothetical protein
LKGIALASTFLLATCPALARDDCDKACLEGMADRYRAAYEFAANGCDKAFLNGNYRFNERVRDGEYFLVDEERGLVFCSAFIDHKGVLDHYRRVDGTKHPESGEAS